MRRTKKKKGRRPKFHGPSRPVTVTLPHSTLARLACVDLDRARAIVKVTAAATPAEAKEQKAVELVEVTAGLAIIIVGPSRSLKKIGWLRLVEVAPMRFLLSIPLGTSIDSLELAVIELLEDVNPDDDWERSLLGQLRDVIRRLRRRGKLSKAEMLFVDMQGTTQGGTPQKLKAWDRRDRREGNGKKLPQLPSNKLILSRSPSNLSDRIPASASYKRKNPFRWSA